MYKKILVPLGGSLRAEAILPHVESLALRLKASATLLYVDETSDFTLERDEVVDVNAYLAKRCKRIATTQAYLQTIIDKWRSIDIDVQMRIGRGAVVACIIHTAKRESIDLVAMAKAMVRVAWSGPSTAALPWPRVCSTASTGRCC